jgi:hypothetical protein
VSIRKKYGARIAEAAGDPLPETREVITLSMADLVAVADELGKPIIHRETALPPQPHAYFVTDGETRYEYLVKNSR